MDDLSLPAGRYLTCPVDVAVDTGGQTRALLMRNRIFAAATGIRPSVLTFGAATDLDERRGILLERGLLSEGVDLLNIYEHFRDTDWVDNDDDPATARPLEDLSRYNARQQDFRDGSPWRRTYQLPGDKGVVYDFQRPDGTTYLRIPQFVFKDAASWPKYVQRVSREGAVVGEFKSVAAWFRQYIRDLAGDERTFVFMDSRHIAPLIAPMRAPHIHLIYLLHNIHVVGDRRWDSPSAEVYQRLMSLVDGFDAFVTLTDRQRQDIAQLRGRTSNLFVVPNPVDMPPAPETPAVRDPRLITVVARLEGQKRLSHAIEAFKHVRAEIPDARMEIWGSGSREFGLQEAINRRGLRDSVTMMGHHPRARDQLWNASAMVMTSLFEGYPLSTLESLSHGCPVVSYDIKYGPREQITDGADGYLVTPGDTRTMAARLVSMLRDPEKVARMSDAALETARRHGNARFVSDWSDVLERAIELKASRTRIDEVTLEVQELTVDAGPGGRVRRRLGRAPHAIASRLPNGIGSGLGTVPPTSRLHLRATLTLKGRPKGADLGAVRVELDAVHESSGAVVPVPLVVERDGRSFVLAADVGVGDLYPPAGSAGESDTESAPEGPDQARLRLRLVWQNSSWETTVRRPDGAEDPGVEVSYLAGGQLRLLRR